MSSADKAMISVDRLQVAYPETPVLKGVSLKVKAGEFVFLQGKSGSGKSTFLKILYRDIEDFSGDVMIDGRSIKEMPRYMTRRIVGTIFQSFELLDRKTALENVMLAGEVIGRQKAEIHAEALLLLDKVGLKGKEHRFPHQLSGGEQQRVAIARALLNRPKILLADEPTGNLDPENAINILALLKEINTQDGITMLIVTHSEELVRAFPARTIVIKDGVILESESVTLLSR